MNDNKEAYSEILAFLDIIDEQYVNRIPNKLIELFEREKSIEYNPKYTLEIPIEQQNLKKETLDLIALLYLNYWYDSEEDKAEIEKIYSENAKKREEELREKYNPDNIFKQKQKENIEKEEVSMIEYKESFFKKLLNKIKRILKI